jgi:uncharacterized protein (TIGR02266 family)
MENGDRKKREKANKVQYYNEDGRGKDDVVFSNNNKRIEERMHVELEVSLTGPHTFFSGFAMDMSKGGIFIATHKISPIGTEFTVSIKLGDKVLEIISEVVWVRNVDSSLISGEEPGMGLKFKDIDEKYIEHITKFLKKREPLLYDTDI